MASIFRHITATLLVALLVIASSTHTYAEANNAKKVASKVLQSIETYRAPPLRSSEMSKEPYDYRKESGAFLPPTLTDVFVADLWQRMTMDLKIQGITIYRVSTDHVTQAMNIYLHRDWMKIAGYRPWTHWNFVRSLTIEQRTRLAKEVADYIYKNGVKDESI